PAPYRGAGAEALRQDQRGLAPDPFQRLVPVRGDDQRGRTRVAGVGAAADVAAVLKRGDQAGEGGRGDAFGWGQVAEPGRARPLDGGQGSELGGGQTRQFVTAE